MEMRFPKLTPLVKALLIAFTVACMVQLALVRYASLDLPLLLALDPSPGISWVWQALTHVLAAPPLDGLAWFAVSLLFLYMMMSPFEERYGAARAGQLAIAGTLGASLPTMLVAAILAFAAPDLRIVGPLGGISPLVIAALGAFAGSTNDGRVMLFPLPVQMKTWHLIALTVLFAVVMAGINGDVSIFTSYVGAIGGGLGFVKWMLRPRVAKPTKPKPRTPGHLRVIRGGAEEDDKPRWLN